MKNKVEILKNRPSVSKEELNQFMDFDQLLEENNEGSKFSSSFKFLQYILVAFGIIILVASFLFFSNKSENIKEEKSVGLVDNPSSNQFSSTELPIETVPNNSSANSTPQNDTPSPNPKPSVATQNEKSPTNEVTSNSEMIKKIELTALPKNGYDLIEAIPKNGMNSLYDYFSAELKYPEHLILEKIEGEVLVDFTIEKTGAISNVSISKSLGSSFDKEAIRVIKNMPAWNPATVNGTKIDSKLSIPLYFKLKH